MGNGHPIAAVVTRSDLVDRMAERTTFFSTFGGNPVACAAALAVLDVLEEEGLVARAAQIGAKASARLNELRARHPGIGDVRGKGAMVAMEFVLEDGYTPDTASVAKIVAFARDAGLILLPTGSYGNVIRLLPPINLSDQELEEGLTIIERAVEHATGKTAQREMQTA